MQEVSGAVVPVAGHGVGFFDDDVQTAAGVAPFLAEGLLADEVVAVYVRAELRDALAAELAGHLGPAGLDAVRATGRYREHDAETTLAGLVDAEGIRPEVLTAVRSEYLGGAGPGRVFGEMVDLLWRSGRAATALDLERAWVAIAAEADLQLRCAYRSPQVFDAHLAHLGELCGVHDHLLTGPTSGVVDQGDRLGITCLPVASAVAGVRTMVRDALDRWAVLAATDDVVLVASELATNAVAHAGTGWRFDVQRMQDVLRLEVSDAATAWPVRRSLQSEAVGGRGVAIVDQLADAWGAEGRPDGTKSVWAEFRLSA